MSEGVFLLPRVADTTDKNSCKQYASTTAFGTAGVVIANRPGRLYQLTIVNKSTTPYFAQVHDSGILPANDDLWIAQRALKALAAGPEDVVFDFGLSGLYCANGISIAISTTGQKLTLGSDDAYAYALYAADVRAPVVTGISPATGDAAGGDSVTITGTGFGGATGATIGGVAVTSFVVVSDTSITCDTGAHAAGVVDVVVTNPAHLGGASAPLRAAFTYT